MAVQIGSSNWSMETEEISKMKRGGETGLLCVIEKNPGGMDTKGVKWLGVVVVVR